MTSSENKFVKDSQVVNRHFVLPNDTNILNNLLGGTMMHWMDMTAAMAAAKHCNKIPVTAVIDYLSFKHPIKLGMLVIIKASVNRAFNTSMEVGIRVEAEDIETGEMFHSNSAYLTFVAIDSATKKKVEVRQIIPETDDEKRRYLQALERREQRLAMSHGIIKYPNEKK